VPPESAAEKTRLTEAVPSSGTVTPPIDTTVNVEPAICTGNCAVTPPALAVTVAVRFDLLVGPEEKVKVAWPVFASVVTDGVLKIPESVAKVTTVFGIAAFAAFSAVMVIVVGATLSVLICGGFAERAIDTTALLSVFCDAPGPHPASRARMTVRKKVNEKLKTFWMNKKFLTRAPLMFAQSGKEIKTLFAKIQQLYPEHNKLNRIFQVASP
jgi:hypothetical protein